jgi:hypothetical protein
MSLTCILDDQKLDFEVFFDASPERFIKKIFRFNHSCKEFVLGGGNPPGCVENQTFVNSIHVSDCESSILRWLTYVLPRLLRNGVVALSSRTPAHQNFLIIAVIRPIKSLEKNKVKCNSGRQTS